MELSTTLGIKRDVDEIYQPQSIAELQAQFPSLRQRHQNISAFSRGQNWGYGCKAPTGSGGLLIDLNRCRTISEFDAAHGLVTIEPGVTYGQLAEFLQKNGDEWIAPVHGGGPTCSVMGNALERGYGITPIADHFSSVMSLKAILRNGEIYEGTLSRLGLHRLDRLFRYGVGPYYDGLFTQSGLGLVTEMTIRLSKRPEHTEMFYFNVYNQSDLPLIVDAVKKSKMEAGSTLGGINLINRERALSMIIDYPGELIEKREAIPEEDIQALAKEFTLTPWLVVGMIYGPKTMVKAARKTVEQNFKHIPKRGFFYTSSNRRLFLCLGHILKKIGKPHLAEAIGKVEQAYQVLNGYPNNVALRLAYWKNTNRGLVNQPVLDPNRDSCGLIWYAPLVEMNAESVCAYVRFVENASKLHGFNPIITLTTIDDLCFDSTIPILFNKSDQKDNDRAMAFYEALLAEGKELGFFPYRLNIQSQTQYDFQMGLFGLEAMNRYRYGSRP